jgi:hypothetical protein
MPAAEVPTTREQRCDVLIADIFDRRRLRARGVVGLA